MSLIASLDVMKSCRTLSLEDAIYKLESADSAFPDCRDGYTVITRRVACWPMLWFNSLRLMNANKSS